MLDFTFEQPILKLDKSKGGYYYLEVSKKVVDKLPFKKNTRLKCNIDDKVEYSCGLNHKGDGDFFIIVSTKRFKMLHKDKGDIVSVKIFEDPNPLGVEVPEVLLVLLDQDENAKSIYDQLTDGKKRSLIHTIKPVKDIDKQIQKILAFLLEENLKIIKKSRSK